MATEVKNSLGKKSSSKNTDKRSRSGLALVLLCVVLAASQLSCSSMPELDEESPSLYFKEAECARFQRKYTQAIEWYKLIQLRFGEYYNILLEAEFSIAQIYYSWPNHNKQAKEHYENVVNFYQRPEIGTDVFPLSYLGLAQRNLESIRQQNKFTLLPPKTDGVHTVVRQPKKRTAETGESKEEREEQAVEGQNES